MKNIISFSIGFIIPTIVFANISLSQVNCWKAVSDKYGKVRGIVKTWKNGSSLYGQILKTYKIPGAPYSKYCIKCPGKLKNKSIVGMIVLWQGHEQSPLKWTDLRILDPESGGIYKATVTMQNNGEKLKVRGYIGLPILGRTQVWLRTTCPNCI